MLRQTRKPALPPEQRRTPEGPDGTRWFHLLPAATLLAAGSLALAAHLFYGQRSAGNFGFPLDDSWIHLRIARNLATGQGWSYNPGEPTGASTTPLWVLLITPLFWLPGEVTTWVKVLGGVLFLANILLAADVARLVTGDRRMAWLAGLLTAWAPTLAWGALSGMEVHLYLLLALLGLRATLTAGGEARPGYAATAWLGLAGWARPELWALLPVAWVYLGRRAQAAPGESGAEHPAGENIAGHPERSYHGPSATVLHENDASTLSEGPQPGVEGAAMAQDASFDCTPPPGPRAAPFRSGCFQNHFQSSVHVAGDTSGNENAAIRVHTCTCAEAQRRCKCPRSCPKLRGMLSASHFQGRAIARSRRVRNAWRFSTNPHPWAPHLLIAAGIVSAFLAFNLLTWGRPLPGTWYAKVAFGAGNAPVGASSRLLHFGGQLMSSVQAAVYSQNPLLAVTLALGSVALWRAGARQRRGLGLLSGVVVAACIAAAATDLGSVGLQHYRRAAHLVTSLNILAAAGALALWDTAALLTGWGKGRGWGLRLAAAAVLAMQLAGLRQGALLYANDVRSINAGDLAAARWIAAHTPADAIVAANDIGALAYFGGRRMVDLVGLAAPEVVAVTATSRPGSAEREERLRDLLLAQGVAYAVIFPEWFPHLAADPALVEVARFTVSRASALAYDQVVIYRVAAP